MTRAYRLLRAAGRLGVPGALPAPPQLLPAGARVLAQGYLNRFAVPLLRGWLLPRWMDEQSDPDCDWFVPRSVTNLMVNQTRRNWTALGVPGVGHPVESLVDRWGLVTPVPGGPSLDWWVQVDGQDVMAPGRQGNVLQTLQGGLPVVVTSYEAGGLRVSSEAWALAEGQGDWVAVQVVLFNIADLPLSGTFSFALRPYNPEGISPVYSVAFDGLTLVADGRPGPYTWPRPERWGLSNLRGGDLYAAGPEAGEGRRRVYDPHGFAHGVLRYRFDIEPWEEAEFLAFMPVYSSRAARIASVMPTVGPAVASAMPVALRMPTPPLFHPPDEARGVLPHVAPLALGVRHAPQGEIDPAYYSRAKAATGLEWRRVLREGMWVELPHRDLQASWEANVAHLLALHDGDSITPGPDLYHSFWMRDAAYMTYALSAAGYEQAAGQLVRSLARRQRRDGGFVSHLGEWDGTGQALWTMGQHLALHHDRDLRDELAPAVEHGARWIATRLARTPGGLMPPGVSSEHFGPPDRYYWDDLWSLAGLRSAHRVLRGARTFDRAAVRLRNTLARAWATDMAALRRECLVAAPGRGIDLGMVGTLVAWWPLRLIPPDSPLLEGTLAAMEEELFYDGLLFVNTGHSGWGTYLNMRIAGCRLLQGSPKGWEMMKRMLRLASPTYNWPEAVHVKSRGGSAGDGHHGWASAEWLLLVRAMLLSDEAGGPSIAPALPGDWLRMEGQVSVSGAPTRYGPLDYTLEWGDEGRTMRLDLEGRWRRRPGRVTWRVPGRVRSVSVDGVSVPPVGKVAIPPGARRVEVEREVEE
jgi:hypothetical protein